MSSAKLKTIFVRQMFKSMSLSANNSSAGGAGCPHQQASSIIEDDQDKYSCCEVPDNQMGIEQMDAIQEDCEVGHSHSHSMPIGVYAHAPFFPSQATNSPISPFMNQMGMTPQSSKDMKFQPFVPQMQNGSISSINQLLMNSKQQSHIQIGDQFFQMKENENQLVQSFSLMQFGQSPYCMTSQMGLNSEVQQKPKKQMNFPTREAMIKYIENFRINYKTELCKNFMQTGICEFNNDCAYAHGLNEVNYRQKSHKNYKTKMCKQWHIETPGQCTYKNKCQFIHNDDQSTQSQGFSLSQNLSFQYPLNSQFVQNQVAQVSQASNVSSNVEEKISKPQVDREQKNTEIDSAKPQSFSRSIFQNSELIENNFKTFENRVKVQDTKAQETSLDVFGQNLWNNQDLLIDPSELNQSLSKIDTASNSVHIKQSRSNSLSMESADSIGQDFSCIVQNIENVLNDSSCASSEHFFDDAAYDDEAAETLDQFDTECSQNDDSIQNNTIGSSLIARKRLRIFEDIEKSSSKSFSLCLNVQACQISNE